MDCISGASILDGKSVAASVRASIRQESAALKSAHGITPGLAVVLVGDDPASQVYVRNKTRACEDAGIRSIQHTLPASTTEGELLRLIDGLNASNDVNGILVQLPLPRQINETVVLERIHPSKDADGFHPYNVGRLAIGNPLIEPCTPKGIMKLLDTTGINVSGKDAVVVGRSNIVGKPIALMLLRKSATVTVCHSRTTDLAGKVSSADIVIAAIGKPNFISGGWIKEGAVVIDVGINRLPDGKLCGDVEFVEAAKRASFITPVPGGVGPMTIAMLLKNTLDAARMQHGV